MAKKHKFTTKITLFTLILLSTFVVHGFTFEDVKEGILGITAEKLNSYQNDVFFTSRLRIESNVNFISYKSWHDDNFIYLPAQAYFKNDPNCCPTSLLLKVKRESHDLVSVEIEKDR